MFRDPDDETHYASISEWDSRSAFNAFARDSGFIWMEEELAYSCTPPQYTVFEQVSDEPDPSALEAPDWILIPA